MTAFARAVCARCQRPITVNGNGRMRSHFCPHRRACEVDVCPLCPLPQAAASWGAPSPEAAIEEWKEA